MSESNATNNSRRYKKKGKNIKNSLGIKILFLMLLFVVGGFIYVFGIQKRLQSDVPQTSLAPIENEPFNILLLGTDTPDFNTHGRTDTILVVNIDPIKKKAFMVSVPRDTKVKFNGRSHKINAAYPKGGDKLVRQAVEDLLDIKIARFYLINWNGFENLVDLVGGVVIDVEKPMYYRAASTYIELKPGKQLLNGEKALGYVRYRNDKQGDIGRMPRQQKFIFALINQSKQIKNIIKLPQLIDGVVDNIRTNSSAAEMLWFAKTFWGIEKSDLKSEILPGSGKMVGGVSYFVVDDKELPRVTAKLGWRTKQAFETKDISVSVNVYNASNVEGLANSISNALSKKGFTIQEVGKARRSYRNTTIFYRKDNLEKAKLTAFYLSKRLSKIELEETSLKNNNADVSVYVGKNGVQPVASAERESRSN